MNLIRPAPLLLLAVALAACGSAPASPAPEAPVPAAPVAPTPGPAFPLPDRPVAAIVTDAWSDEASRDNSGETEQVFRHLGIRPGQAIADIGAGSGYYTVRLSPAVGRAGQVYANDIMPDYLARLKRRVEKEGLTNVTLILGEPGNAKLPEGRIDVALMVHMYHEIEQPFGLLWHLHESLRPAAPATGSAPATPPGRIAIIDADRPTMRHGTPPALLRCELKAAGYRETAFHDLGPGGYLAVFEPVAQPDPAGIRPCPAPR
jgi:predicted methyltransferase